MFLYHFIIILLSCFIVSWKIIILFSFFIMFYRFLQNYHVIFICLSCFLSFPGKLPFFFNHVIIIFQRFLEKYHVFFFYHFFIVSWKIVIFFMLLSFFDHFPKNDNQNDK